MCVCIRVHLFIFLFTDLFVYLARFEGQFVGLLCVCQLKSVNLTSLYVHHDLS